MKICRSVEMLRSCIFMILFSTDFVAGLIQLSPEYINVIENKSLELNCSFDTPLQTNYIEWSKSDISISAFVHLDSCSESGFLEQSHLYSVNCGNLWSSVSMKIVDRNQSGVYWQCGELGANGMKSNEAHIFVYVPVTSVEIISHVAIDEISIKENTSTRFTCQASPSRPVARLLWYLKNPHTLQHLDITTFATQSPPAGNDESLVAVISELNYTMNRSLIGWHIYCRATNDRFGNVTSQEKTLNILFPPDGPPVITEARNGSKYQIAENEVAHLSCYVSGGNPLAHIVWLCLGGHTSNVRESNTVTSSIIWTAHRNQQNSSCVCVAEHAFGNTITFVTVDILYKASVLHFFTGEESTDKNTFTVSENDTISFSCITDSKPPPNVTVSHNGRIIHVSVSNKSLEFTRKHTQCSDLGIYVCSAMNEYNNDKPSFGNLTLNVICSPRPYPFFEPIENVSSPLHTSATLWFSALAFPEPGPPGFTWYYLNGTERIMLTNTHNVVISSLSSHTSLTIRNVRESEYGEYILKVTNVIGVYEQKFSLKPFNSTTCSNIVANSTSTVAFVAVGVGTCLATLLFVGSILFVHRFMRRKPKLLQNVLSYHRHKEENEPTSTDSGTITEYEQISMKTVTVSASTEQNKESVPDTCQNYDTLDKSRKEASAYSQLSALHQQQKISRTKTEGASVDNNQTQHTSKDYINIKI